MKKVLFIIVLFVISSVFVKAFAFSNLTIPTLESQVQGLSTKVKGLNPEVIKLALKAYLKARAQGFDQQQVLTIIDYSKPSTQPRLWVLDIKQQNVLYNEWVAHGKNSGGNVPSAFSNKVGSEKSSLGVFVTKNTYIGKHGLSLKLSGLEKGFNENAEARAIVLHAADYVNPNLAKNMGRLGRSWGCPAIRPEVLKPIVNIIKGGTVIFAYFPDKKWLEASTFINF